MSASRFDARARAAEAKRVPSPGAIAHEVNNPLSVVLANADFLREVVDRLERERPSELLDEARAYLADLHEGAERIRLYIKELSEIHEAQKRAYRAGESCTTATTAASVLVIDDDPNVAKVLERVLRSYDVTTRLSSVEALADIRRGARFDVIVCDVVMPVLAAPALYAMLEQEAPEQAARVIFITGGPTTPETEAFVQRMSDRLIAKPFLPRHVVARVERVLSSR